MITVAEQSEEQKTKAKRIIADYEKMRSDRSTYEQAWDDIRCYVRPNVPDFRGHHTPGDVRTTRMYDSAAMQANTDLAGDVYADLFNPSERSFGIAVNGPVELNRNPDVIEWTDSVADAIAAAWSDERSQLTSSAHETIQDITSFGNGIISQEWNADTWQLQFMARPLAGSFFATDSNGVVNRLSRCEKGMQLRQIREKWPEVKWDGIDKEPWEKEYSVIHSVMPRVEAERQYGREDGYNMPFKSCWVLKEKCLLLNEGGYTSFPYHCPRWNKVADEIYGRGPAINCLPAIRMLNRMKFTTLKAAQKATDPTVWLPCEGVRLPYKDEPGGVNFYDPSMFPQGFTTFTQEHRGNFPVTFEMMEAERAEIRKAFYTDWMEWFPKAERQTAMEIRELQARKLNKMAPLLGRLQTELLVPMVQRSFELLARAGMIPPAPPMLMGRSLRVVYVSASARAQAASEAAAMMLYVQQLVPVAQVKPDVLDAVNFDAYAQELAIRQRIVRRILRSDQEIMAMRQQRAQQEQAAALAEAAEPVSGAVLNIAKAQEIGGIAA